MSDQGRIATLEAEVERLREKNKELNRRATRAEAAARTTVEDCQRQGVSIGRALANTAAEMYLRERDEAVKLLRRALPATHIASNLADRISWAIVAEAIEEFLDRFKQESSDE